MTEHKVAPKINATERQELMRALGGLALILWAGSCYKQSLPYPFYGALWAAILSLMAFVTAWLIFLQPVYGKVQFFALFSAFGFSFWVVLRWLADGSPAVGIENVITVVNWCAWFFVSAHLIRLWQANNNSDRTTESCHRFPLLIPVFAAVATLASLFAVHAILQYTILYDEQLQELRASLGTRTPTPLEMGLIHHLQLKRVASVWGDPNAFGCFCVFGMGAAWYLWVKATSTKVSWPLRVGALFAVVLCSSGIFLSGSRGALLDTSIVGGIVAMFYLRRRLLVPALPLSLMLIMQGAVAVESQPPEKRPALAWWARSDTIRERVYYGQVGWGIFRKAPLTGAGPGCVEKFYAQLKPADARESKYLHNWALQIGAETGVLGLALFGGTIVLVLKCLFPCRRRLYDEVSVLTALIVMFLADSFVELSFNQRELMATFGACCGLAVGLPNEESGHKCRGVGRRNAFVGIMTLLLALALALLALPRAIQSGFLQMAEGTLETGENALAQKYLKRAELWGKRDVEIYIFRAALARQRGDAAGEEEALRRALELTPWSANLHAQMAEVLERRGRSNEAEKFLRRAVELYPSKAEHWHELACFLERHGRLAEAYEASRNAVRFSYLYPERDRALLRRVEEKLCQTSATTNMTSGTKTTNSIVTKTLTTTAPR